MPAYFCSPPHHYKGYQYWIEGCTPTGLTPGDYYFYLFKEDTHKEGQNVPASEQGYPSTVDANIAARQEIDRLTAADPIDQMTPEQKLDALARITKPDTQPEVEPEVTPEVTLPPKRTTRRGRRSDTQVTEKTAVATPVAVPEKDIDF